MNELIKIVQTFAGDTDNELPADTYTITIGATKDKTGIKATTGSVPTNLTTELNNASPNWATNLTTKSKKMECWTVF